MISTLRLTSTYVRQYTLQWFAGRSFVVTMVLNQAVGPLVSLAVWSAALPGRKEISAYFVALLITRLLTVSYENHTLANRIYSGELADDLLRPHSPLIAPLAENLALRLWHVTLGLPLILLAFWVAGIHLHVGQLGFYLPVVMLAMVLRFLFTFTMATTAFWGQRTHGLVALADTAIFLLGGGAFPIAMAPDWAQNALRCLPFWGMYGFPAEILSGNPSATPGGGVLSQLAWLVVLWFVLRMTWRAGTRRYASVGG